MNLLETLEQRRLWSVTAYMDAPDGLLRIEGTDAADRFTVVVQNDGTGRKVVHVYNGEVTDTWMSEPVNGQLVTGWVSRQWVYLDSIKRIEIVAGGGNDTVICGRISVPVHVWGGNGNDTLSGGKAGDLLIGGAGNDRIWGGGGDDRIVGKQHNDRLEGGDGDDTILGGDGDDRVYGNDGTNLLHGGAGSDSQTPHQPDEVVRKIGMDLIDESMERYDAAYMRFDPRLNIADVALRRESNGHLTAAVSGVFGTGSTRASFSYEQVDARTWRIYLDAYRPVGQYGYTHDMYYPRTWVDIGQVPDGKVRIIAATYSGDVKLLDAEVNSEFSEAQTAASPDSIAPFLGDSQQFGGTDRVVATVYAR